MRPLRLLIIPCLVLSVVSTRLKSQCVAGVTFLRTFENEIVLEDSSTPSPTYVINLSYNCEESPLPRIEKLKKSVRDPFVSFHLKPNRVKRNAFSEYGSGDYDEDDDDEDDDEDEEDEHAHDHDIPIIEPSNHVIPLLPTPTIVHNSFSSVPPIEYPEVTISPTRVLSSYGVVEESNDLVRVIGSGDGPLVLTTPVYYPTSEEPILSSAGGYTSSFPTPPLHHVIHPIPKQRLDAGEYSELNIDTNTFQPPCSSYELATPEPFVSLVNRTVMFFPTTDQVSEYNLTVQCTSNPTAKAELYVAVRQRQKSRVHNHAFEIEFGMIRENYTRVENLNRVVQSIKSQMHSNNTTDLIVLTTELESYPFRITFVNETILSNVCPVNELKAINDGLRSLTGLIKLENVKLKFPPNNQCEAKHMNLITGEASVVNYGENFPPAIKNQIDHVTGHVGEYLVYNVKEDFCYDPEDGGTRNLKIELKNNEMNPVDSDSWLQFDAKNQEFYGLPMKIESKEFALVCSDKEGKSANDVLELSVLPRRTDPSRFVTEFNLHFQSIPFTPNAIRKFIEKLSTILSPDIQVNDYAYSNNHVLFKWFNTSNPSTENEIAEIRKTLLSDDGPVNKRFYEHFSPDFNISVASVIPLRSLLSENNPVEDDQAKGFGGKRYFDFDENEQGAGGGQEQPIDNVVLDTYSGYLTTYIIPSVLIAIMILLALIIACLLSRKNKYTQASTEDDSPNAQAYKNAKKGVPVIFQDELDEKLFGPGARGKQNIYEPPAAAAQHGPVSPPPQHGQGPARNYGHPHQGHSSSATPQPPDYQNSISRSLRNRPSQERVLPPHLPPHPPHHSPYNHNQIDSYAPPPGINYYGIHNSNSGGGFSDRGNIPQNMGPGGNKMPPPPYVPP
ncbi:unnamed protein product [Orchesella dallaii]|uniref:Peptidase S72 domain-containing protein n=1 Tax=Orchesella dallaii TaxID=48710 RepID=A0ABP1QM69_9HEXA